MKLVLAYIYEATELIKELNFEISFLKAFNE